MLNKKSSVNNVMNSVIDKKAEGDNDENIKSAPNSLPNAVIHTLAYDALKDKVLSNSTDTNVNLNVASTKC